MLLLRPAGVEADALPRTAKGEVAREAADELYRPQLAALFAATATAAVGDEEQYTAEAAQLPGEQHGSAAPAVMALSVDEEDADDMTGERRAWDSMTVLAGEAGRWSGVHNAQHVGRAHLCFVAMHASHRTPALPQP